MKKFLVLVLAIIFTVTSFAPDALGQKRKKKKNRGLATNLAIVGGSTVVGALVGGRKGAAIGGGAGLLYASSRKGTKRRSYNSKYRRYAKIGGGALLGGGLGAFGGKKGAVIGSLAGAGATYLYTRNGRKYYRARNGKVFYRR